MNNLLTVLSELCKKAKAGDGKINASQLEKVLKKHTAAGQSKEGDTEWMQNACRVVHKELPDAHGFIILSAPFTEDPNAIVRYGSNVNREDVVKMLRAFLFQIGAEENWMKNIR